MDLYAKSTSSNNGSSNSANAIGTSTSVLVVTPASVGEANVVVTSAAAASAPISGDLPKQHSSSQLNINFPAVTDSITSIAQQYLLAPSYSNSNSNTIDMCSCDYQNSVSPSGTGKRKRRLTADSNDSKDTEIGFEPPSAKRQQRLPALYGSDQSSNVSSVASSVYTSPAADTQSTQELISLRSSPAETLSEAPHSPLPDSPDSPPSPDRGNKQLPVVVRYVAQSAATAAEADDEAELDDSCEDYSYDEDDNDDEEISSSSTSPGERTPSQLQSVGHSNNNNNNKEESCLDSFMTSNNYNYNYSPVETPLLRSCPLPSLSWANASDVWKQMCKRDEDDARRRSSGALEHHPGLQSRMRAILLDWLMEVCEVYKLHRETFYLAVDYLDRYLHVARKVQKTHLQLIGITCLFVAAKVEEIYPPKIGEFAYVTDGACTENDILQYEKLLLQALGWDISPITVSGWLAVYMQLNANNRTPASFSRVAQQSENDDAFIYPQFSGFEFVQTSQLLDLCTLDVCMANYSYSTLAAAAISHTFNRETALRCSRLDWSLIEPCARWMEPFFRVISKKAPFLQLHEQNEQVTNKFGLGHVCPNIVTDDSHIIQTHTTTMDMYDELLMAQEALHALRARTQASPATALRAPESLLTPPASSHKPDEYLGDEEEAAVGRSGQSQSQVSANIANRENIALTSNGNGRKSSK